MIVISGYNGPQDSYSEPEEERNPISGAAVRLDALQRELTPDNVEYNDADPVQRVARSRVRHFEELNRPSSTLNHDFGYGLEYIGEEDCKYSHYIKQYKPEILRCMKLRRQIRGLSPQGLHLKNIFLNLCM